MSFADRLRSRAHAAMEKLPGKAGELARKANEALGRPLADADELEDRRAFEARTATGGGSVAAAAVPKPAAGPAIGTDIAPVVVYHMDKTRRDATKLTDMLDAEKIPYTVMNIQEDQSAQYSVKRDSNGHRLPLVMIAGDAIGGRAELSNLIASGELRKRVYRGS